MKLALWVVVSSVVATGCTSKPDTAAANSEAPSVIMNGQGEMAGEATMNSIILQSRLTSVNRLVDGDVSGAPGVARFEVATSPDFVGSQATEWLQAVREHDFIVKKRVEQLNPGTRYFYRLIYGPDEKSIQLGAPRSFKTLPGADAAVAVSFVVVTGMNYHRFYRGAQAYKGSDRELGYPALKTILDVKPDFFVGNGDNVYYDYGVKAAQNPDEMRRYWHEQFVQPRMIDLMGQVASYWQKDDHDNRYNDSDNTGDRAPLPALGKSIFEEQMPVVAPADKNPMPYRTHRVSKDLQIWMTEGREYRSPNMSNDPTKTLWGTEQLEWLKQTLLESDATFKILISPTPMVGPDVMKHDNMAGPGGFNLERDRFFAWLRDNRMLEKNFYVISGDRHWQYYSIDPAGVQEFSTGAIMDENGRMGVPPGDPLGNDPKKLIKQPYTSKEPSGGFLKVTVQPGPRPTAFFRFYDEHGVELYSVTKEATSRRR